MQRPRPAAGADSGLAGAGERHFEAGATLPIPAPPDIRSARNGTGLARAPAGFAAIAQLVEHVIRNDGVGGSNPSCGTSAFNVRPEDMGNGTYLRTERT
jgi:hypothetical protein